MMFGETPLRANETLQLRQHQAIHCTLPIMHFFWLAFNWFGLQEMC